MPDQTLDLTNQFGETTKNYVVGGGFEGTPIADQTLLGNFSGSSAPAAGTALQTVSTKLPAKTGITSTSALATPVTAITIALSTSNTYTDAAVNTAVNAALVSVVADLQAQLTQMNTILAALKAVV